MNDYLLTLGFASLPALSTIALSVNRPVAVLAIACFGTGIQISPSAMAAEHGDDSSVHQRNSQDIMRRRCLMALPIGEVEGETPGRAIDAFDQGGVEHKGIFVALGYLGDRLSDQ